MCHPIGEYISISISVFKMDFSFILTGLICFSLASPHIKLLKNGKQLHISLISMLNFSPCRMNLKRLPLCESMENEFEMTTWSSCVSC